MTKLLVAIALPRAQLLHLPLPRHRRGDPASRELRANSRDELGRLALRRAGDAWTREIEKNLGVTDYLLCNFSETPRRARSRTSTSATTPARSARKAAEPARTRSTRRRTACRARAGTSSTTGPCRSTCPAFPRTRRHGQAPDHRQGKGSPARLLLVPVAGPGDLARTGRRSSTSAGTAPRAGAPTARWCASRCRSSRTTRRRPRRPSGAWLPTSCRGSPRYVPE